MTLAKIVDFDIICTILLNKKVLQDDLGSGCRNIPLSIENRLSCRKPELPGVRNFSNQDPLRAICIRFVTNFLASFF